MAVLSQDQKYLPDVKRAFAVMLEVTGEAFKTIDALGVTLAIMADLFGSTHGEEATTDFLNRVVKFTQRYPFIPAAYTEEDRLKGVALAQAVETAWKAMQPPLPTRAVQMVTWLSASYAWQALYGEQCVKDWRAMMEDWSKRWDGGNKVH
jgi:hypothetical protein